MWFKKDNKTSNSERDIESEGIEFDSFMDSWWLKREQEFQYQSKNIKFRVNVKSHLSLGKVLSSIFDVKKEELSKLNINTKESLSIISDLHELWEYNIISPAIILSDDGLPHFGNNAILSVTYTDPNYKANNGTIIIHVAGVGGISNKTIYFSITVIFPPTLVERKFKGILPQPKCISLLVAYDNQSPEEAEKKYLSLKESINQKLSSDQYDNLTKTELELLEQIHPDLSKCLAFGKEAMKEKTFLHAISYFEIIYKKLKEKHLIKGLSDVEYEVFLETSYLIGFCYVDLQLPEKALTFLEISASLSSNIKYKQEYLNCLSITKDIRTSNLIDIEADKLLKKPEESWINDDFSYYSFLLRRKAYVLIDMEKYDDAEKLLRMLLEADPNNYVIKNELTHIENIRKKD